MNKITKQCVAAVASLAMAGTLCVAGAVVAGSSAWAADACNNGAPWDAACAAQKGTITINKTDENKVGLNGVTFALRKVTKIGNENMYNLKFEDGWISLASKVKKLNESVRNGSAISVTYDHELNDQNLVKDTTKTVDGKAGVLKFPNLEIGLYRVDEISAPEGYTPNFEPFFVTVPQITRQNENTNNTYTYDVSVSPKNVNVKENVKKTSAMGEIIGAGDTLTYTISAKPNKTKLSNGGKDLTSADLKGLAVYDDALIDAYTTDSLAASAVKEVKIDGNTTAFTEGANNDYTTSIADSDTDKGTGNAVTRKRIMVKFNDSGLTKICTELNKVVAAGNKVPEIKVTLKLTLKKTNDFTRLGKDKTIVNKSGFIPGNGTGDGTPTPGQSTNDEFRKFQIFKYDGTTEKGNGGTDGRKALSGAVFKAFTSETEAAKCAANPDANKACDKAMTNFGDTEGTAGKTTGNDGKTSVYVAKAGNAFYVVETKAPDGYARSTKVYSVNVTTGSGTEVFTEPIANIPDNGKDGGSNWFTLPKTGAAGVIIFALIGLGLVGSGMFVFLKNRKKEEEQAA
ncbi:SpaH/EbpB family LPXTG-anchored major pilin [Gardnerella pickettii]|uniref:SpaH/EbpB family LPXTG-anchored major pilin n=1 Tax=Gardnerella pickettii TaxID=2914924 RepID=UPI0039EFA7A8